jgi:hypothetical protein
MIDPFRSVGVSLSSMSWAANQSSKLLRQGGIVKSIIWNNSK